MTVILKHIKTI